MASLLPRYKEWRQLSRTGMSAVYLATDTKLRGRRVAVKVLDPGLAHRPDYRRRFIRETHIIASLRHHNIIDIIGMTEDGEELLYLVMPYIEGPDLRTLLYEEGKPLQPARMVHIVRQVAKALDHTHRKDVVHRDVKPANILVDGEDEHVYLCDFGISLVRGDDRLTRFGPSPGTPDYAPPERYQRVDAPPDVADRAAPPDVAGPVPDPREDVYSLGVVVRDCLAGGPSSAGTVLPKPFDRIVSKATSWDPGQRYDSCGALVADLEQALNRRRMPQVADTVNRSARVARSAFDTVRARPLVAAGVVLAALAAVGVPLLIGGGPDDGQLDRVPAEFRAHCAAADASAGSPGASDVLSCAHGGQTVVFSLFDGSSGLDDAYTRAVRQSGVTGDSGDCTAAVGAEHRYPQAGKERGRVLCFEHSGRTDFVWTDESERTIAQAEGRDTDQPGLAPAWASWVGLPAFPTAAEKSLIDLVHLTNCHRTPAGAVDVYRNVSAAVDCDPSGDGANAVTYYRFDDLAALKSAHTGDAARVNAPAGVDCSDGTAPGHLGDHALDMRSVVVGDLLCYLDKRKAPVLEWTEEPLLVLGRATGTTSAKLAGWWRGYFGFEAPTSQLATAVDRQATPAFPDASEQALLSHVPASSRVDCMRPPQEQITANVGTAPVTAVVCGPTRGSSIVFYYQFDDAAAMNGAYARNTDISGPDCTTHPADFHGDAPYSKSGAHGRLACATVSGHHSLAWTDNTLEILTLAYGGDDQLLDWWRFDAGPVRKATGS